MSSNAKIENDYEFTDQYLNTIMNTKLNGVNPYVDIYSARVLNGNNTTTVDCLIKGIEWAISKDVNIINISCGFDQDSTKLHNVIKKAYDKGILIVAAAGNEGTVKYTAKYKVVMQVGSINCTGNN